MDEYSQTSSTAKATKRPPQLKHFEISRGRFHDPLKVLVAMMTLHAGLESITVGQDQDEKSDQGHTSQGASLTFQSAVAMP